jgi:hypothetical protein
MRTQDYIQFFSNNEQGKALIHKALTTGTTSGGPLIAEHLDTIITNELVRLVPELAIPEYKYDPQKTHEFNRVTALPAAGSAMGEASTTPTRASAMERAEVTLKVMKRKGSVTGFLQASAEKEYDAESVETENHLQAFGNDMATYMIHGNAGADAYTFTGIDRFISTYRVNETWTGVVPTNLSPLDNLIDASNSKKAQSHRRAFIMSPQMLTKFSSLWTQVRDNRSAVREGVSTIEVNGGHRLQTFRDIPILESSQTRAISTMTAITLAHAGAGGGIPDATRYFRVAPVTWDGEQEASPEVADTSSSSDTITISFTAFPGALFYKVYESQTTAQLTLKKVVSAFTYDASGTITASTTSIVFSTNPTTADATSVTTAMQADKPIISAAGIQPESVYLWDLHPHQGLGKMPYTNKDGNRLDGIATIIPLAKTDDTSDFLIKSYIALADAFEATSGVHKGLRVS